MNRMIWLLLSALLFPAQVVAADGDTGTIRGTVGGHGQTACRGVVSLWDGSDGRSPDPRRYLIIPFSAVNLAPSCAFELQAPAGSYYVGALLRKTPGPELGPPRPGDLVFMTPDPHGGVVRVELAAGQTIDIGNHAEGWRYEGMQADAPQGVSGTVRDMEGKPVAGVLVFAFADAEMTRSPLAVSARTDEEGRYLLRIDRPGQVYLRVKDDYGGGAPVDGGYVGVFGGAVPAVIEVSAAEMTAGRDIQVFKVPAGRIRSRGDAVPMPRGEKSSN
ncbi:carboxypeptidase-like regulatory domain-containing protein [Trichloromonas sp.]|uniref:carboxypeptidase-like regulatory domain-containing protein n=1 Tax=Trichloromonas sp. TaxID=3069249 RepID=UPI003D814ADD